MFSIILIGGPGSGKGTQAEFLVKDFNLKYIPTGLILRKLVESKNPLGLKIQNIIQKGDLLSDELVTEIVSSEIQNYDFKNLNFLIDGFPRTEKQSILLDQILLNDFNKKLALFIDIPDNKVLVERLTQRALKENRADDNKDIILKRIEIHKKEIKDIISFYKKNHSLIQIDGSDSIENVRTLIKSQVSSWLENI